MGGGDGGAEDAAAAAGDRLHQAGGAALGDGAVVLAAGETQHPHLAMGFAGRRLAHADMGQFGIGVRDPGQRLQTHPGRQPQQGVADDDAGMVVGEVGELEAAGAIADGEDAAVRAAQAGIDRDAAPVVGDGGRLQPQAFDVGPAPGRHQQMGALDAGGSALLLEGDFDAARLAGDALDGGVLDQLHAVGQQAFAHRGHQFGIVFGQDGGAVEDGDAAAQAAMGLGHLAADGAAAQNQQAGRPFGVVEQRFVGEEGHAFEAGDGGDGGAAAGRHHEAAGADEAAAGLQGAAPGEAGGGGDDLDPEAAIALHGIVGRDGGDDLPDMAVDGREIDGRFRRRHAEGAGMAHGMGGMAGRQQRLGRHAAVIEAVAAHLVAFDQGHPGAHMAGGIGGGKTAGTGAYDAQIEAFRGHVSSLSVRRAWRAPQGAPPRRRRQTTGASATTARPARPSRISRLTAFCSENASPLARMPPRPLPMTL